MADQTKTDKRKLEVPLLADWVFETLDPFRKRDPLEDYFNMVRAEAPFGQMGPGLDGMNPVPPFQPDNGRTKLVLTPLPAHRDESQGSIAERMVPFQADKSVGRSDSDGAPISSPGNQSEEAPDWLRQYPWVKQSLYPKDDIEILREWGLELPGDQAIQEAFGTSPQTGQDQGSEGMRKLMARIGGYPGIQAAPAQPGAAQEDIVRGTGYGNSVTPLSQGDGESAGGAPNGVGNPVVAAGQAGNHPRPISVSPSYLGPGEDHTDATAIQDWEGIKNTPLRPLSRTPTDQELLENNRKAEEYNRANPWVKTSKGLERKYQELGSREPDQVPRISADTPQKAPKVMEPKIQYTPEDEARIKNQFRNSAWKEDGTWYLELNDETFMVVPTETMPGQRYPGLSFVNTRRNSVSEGSHTPIWEATYEGGKLFIPGLRETVSRIMRGGGQAFVDPYKVRDETDAFMKSHDTPDLNMWGDGSAQYYPELEEARLKNAMANQQIFIENFKSMEEKYRQKFGKDHPILTDVMTDLPEIGISTLISSGLTALTKSKALGTMGASFLMARKAADEFMDAVIAQKKPQSQEELDMIKQHFMSSAVKHGLAKSATDAAAMFLGYGFMKVGGLSALKDLGPARVKAYFDTLEDVVGRHSSLKIMADIGILQLNEQTKALITNIAREDIAYEAGLIDEKRSAWEILQDQLGPVFFKAFIKKGAKKGANAAGDTINSYLNQDHR